MHYLRVFRAPRTVDLLLDVVLLCSLLAAALRLDPVVLTGAEAVAVFNGVPDVVVAAIVGIGTVGAVVGVITTELPLLFDAVPLFIRPDDEAV